MLNFLKFLLFVFFLYIIIKLFILLPAFKIIVYILAMLMWFLILCSEREHYSKTIWLMILLINPILGSILFLLFGQSIKQKNIFGKKIKSDYIISKYDNPKGIINFEHKFERVVHNIGQEFNYSDSEFSLLNGGKIKFDTLIEKIEQCKKYVHIQYYIFKDSEIANKIINLLIKKVKSGIIVRVLLDQVGSKNLSIKNRKLMLKNGIKLSFFGQNKFAIFNDQINFRNHRKIVVIDGEYAFIGGINVADEYIGYSKKFGMWNDIHLMIKGYGVKAFILTFAKDWYYATNENFIKNDENFYLDVKKSFNKDESMTLLNNGADNKDVLTKDVYFKLITSVNKSLIIFTPYLIPDYDIVKAITTCALNGVDVKIFVPGIGDKKIVQELSRTYYYSFIKSGVKIFEVNDSFLHAKVVIIDEDFLAIGTTNLDYRSFNLNFESTAFIKSEKLNKQLREISNGYQENSKVIEIYDLEKRKFFTKLVANIAQLMSPLF